MTRHRAVGRSFTNDIYIFKAYRPDGVNHLTQYRKKVRIKSGIDCQASSKNAVRVIRTFIRHKDRRYKIETETEGIKTRLKSVMYHYTNNQFLADRTATQYDRL